MAISLYAEIVEVLNKTVQSGLLTKNSFAIVSPDFASPILTPFIQISLPGGLGYFEKRNFSIMLCFVSLEKKISLKKITILTVTKKIIKNCKI